MFFITFCLLFLSLLAASEGQGKVKVKRKQDATLQCRGPRDAAVVVLLEWIRPERISDGYVFAYQNGRPHEDNQLPSFRGRAELRDPEMKLGDVSLVLRRAGDGDAGTYVCRVVVVMRGETTYTEVRHVIDLKVLRPGDPADSDSAGGSADGGFTLILLTVIFLVCLLGGLPALLICGTSKRRDRNPMNQRHCPSVDHDDDGVFGGPGD